MKFTLSSSKGFSGFRISVATLLVFCAYAMSFSQQITITGKITSSEDKSIMPGVNVIVKGTASGAVTDQDGNFSVSAPADATLIFSYIGFVTQEIPVGNRTVMDVVLVTDTKQLSEIVVTALGIRRDVKTVGFANQAVQGSELVKAREPNTVNALVGKVAGLSIGSSPEMLGRPNVVLRGNSDVLFVVNGVPINSDTWNLPADDIETYTVLKGPNAAALYGFRGQNGAIVITTKNGSKPGTSGKNWSVDFNSSTMVESGFTAFPKNNELYGRGTNFKYSFGNGLYDFGPQSTVGNQRLPEWGPQFNGQLVRQYDSPYDPVTNTRTPTPYTARGTNNLKNFLQPGLLSTNNIAFAKAGDGYDVRVSYSHSYQKGLVPNTQLNIENININSNFDLSPKFKLETRANINYQHTPNIPDVSYGPNSYVYMFGVYGSDDYDVRDLKNYYKGPMGVSGLQQYNFEYGRLNNPYFMAYEWLRGHNKADFFGSARLTYKVNKDLDISFRSQITTWNQTRTEKTPAGIGLNTYLPWWSFGWHGDYRVDQRSMFENNTDVLVNYKKKLSDFTINAFAGASARLYEYNSSFTSTKVLSVPGVYNFNNSVNPLLAYTYNANMNVFSGYYSLDLGYKNYVNVSTTGRVDKLSTFDPSSSPFFYPSVAISSVISDYAKLPEFISFLKVRASYADVKGGLTQSQAGSAFQMLTGSSLNSGLIGYGSELYSSYDGPSYANQNQFGSGTFYNGTNSITYPTTIAKKGLKPFTVTSDEFGLDIRFLDNRLGLDVTYFRNLNGPSITPIAADPATGYYSANENALTTEKKGWEITLQGNPIRSESFRWDILANWSTFKETLYSIGGGLSTFALNGHNYKVGERMDAFYSTAFIRDGSGNVVYGFNQTTSTGSGVPLPTPGGLANNAFLGNLNPDWSFGINNKFTYKSLSLSFQFDGRVGGKIYDRVWYQMMNGGTALESTQGALGAARNAEWQSILTAIGGADNYDARVIAGTLPAATPSYVGNGVVITGGTPTIQGGKITNLSELTFAPNTTATTVQNYLSSGVGGNFDEAYMIDRTYAKLREVNLTYNIPVTFFGKNQTLIKRASVSLVGRNLLYFAARKDFDIDQYASGYNAYTRSITGNSGSVDLSSPTTRRFGININLGF